MFMLNRINQNTILLSFFSIYTLYLVYPIAYILYTLPFRGT